MVDIQWPLFDDVINPLRIAQFEIIADERFVPGADLAGMRISANGEPVKMMQLVPEKIIKRILPGADLNGINLDGCEMHHSDLRTVNLENAVLQGAHISEVNLAQANLRGANLRGAYVNANLNSADLSGAILTGATLDNCTLDGAILRGADLSGVTLIGTSFSGADITDVITQEQPPTLERFKVEPGIVEAAGAKTMLEPESPDANKTFLELPQAELPDAAAHNLETELEPPSAPTSAETMLELPAAKQTLVELPQVEAPDAADYASETEAISPPDPAGGETTFEPPEAENDPPELTQTEALDATVYAPETEAISPVEPEVREDAVEFDAEPEADAAPVSAAISTPPLQPQGELWLDDTQQCVYVKNKQIALDPVEFAVLGYLFEHAGQFCSSEEIGATIAAQDVRKTIDQITWGIRKKIERKPYNPRYLKPVHEDEQVVGYRLDVPG